MVAVQQRGLRWTSRRAVAIGVTLVVVTGGGLLAHQGKALRYVFPAMALLAAMALFRKHQLAYVNLVWWLWILTPEIRRLSDYQAGYDSVNPITIAPFLAGALCALVVVRQASAMRRARIDGFVLVVAGLVVATVVGLFLNGLSAAFYGFANWAIPPIFAAYLALSWKSYPELRRTVFRLATSSLTVISVYGIVQFFVYPAWDKYWGANSGIGEYTTATAKHVRPFSTLNSAGPFAGILVLLILIVFQYRTRWRVPVLAVAIFALVLSQVRSAWGAFVISIGFLLVTEREFLGRGLRVAIAVIIPVIALGTQTGAVTKLIDSRLHSLTALKKDESYTERFQFVERYAGAAFLDPIGHGIASTTTATKLVSAQQASTTIGTFDNGILVIPFTLGWLGSGLYVGGGLLLVGEALRAPKRDPMVGAGKAIGVATIGFMFFGPDLTGVQGFFCWLPLGLSLASRQFAHAPPPVVAAAEARPPSLRR